MTGLPTLLVQLDDPAGSGTWPYDITAYVDLRKQWSLTRGRADELSEVDPAVARLVLNNNDGRFTLGSATYGGLMIDQRVRITETVGATTSRRIVGNVQDWPTTFEDAGARNVPCAISVVDRQARLGRRSLPNPLRVETLAATPFAYYPLGDAVGATSSEDVSGNSRKRLRSAGAAGSPFVAGVEGAGGTGFQFGGGNYLRADYPSFVCSAIGVAFLATAPPAASGSLARVSSSVVGTTSVLNVTLEPDGSIDSTLVVGIGGGATSTVELAPTVPVNLCDGVPHFVLAYYAPDYSALRLYVDGVLVREYLGPSIASPPDKDRLLVGLGLKSTAVVSHVTLYSGGPTSAQALSQYLSVMGTSEDSDERFARIAGYAGLGPGDLVLESGVLTSTAPQTLEKEKAAPSLSAVSTAEGGTWFVRGDGKTVLQNRTHRTYKASQSPAVVLVSEDVEHDDLQITTDKQYLQNVVTGSRVEGGNQESRAEASITSYDEYPGDLSGLLVTTDDEVKDRCNWQVNAYGQPLPRLNRVSLDLLSLPAAKVEQILALELGDRITISGLPSTSPISTADLIVEGSEETQSAESWQLTLNTVSAALFRAWILGDATYGVLGTTTRLHY